MVLSINNLSKKYDRLKAVDQLSLEIEEGMVFGFLGPNGSGKTTTLGMVLDIIRPTEGDYEWFGGKYEADDARKRIGTLLETPNFFPYMSAVKNLEIVAHIRKVANPRIEEHLDMVGLLDRKDSKFKTYSLGMKQRLAIAAALVGQPEVLIFDEPTNGLDPQGIAEVREIISRVADSGKSIIMASHILNEVERICSHVAIIKQGKLLATGTVGAIISDDIIIEVGAADLEQLRALFKGIPGLNNIEEEEHKLILSLSSDFSASELNKMAMDKGIILSHLHKKTKSLEAEFLEITSAQN